VSRPDVSEPFYWIDAPWGSALRCRALDGIAEHLFTTREWSPTADEDWRGLAAAVGARDVATLTQVHGNAVVVIRRDAASAPARPAADAVVSNHPEIAVSVRAADCVPLLMADRRTGAVAAVHAGWRGTAAGVARAAIDTMQREFGTMATDVVAAIGPSIGPCCYEVGSELVDAFAAAGHARHLIDRWFLARPPAPGTAARPSLRLDVAGANRDQLILAGVDDTNIHVAALCTAMHLEVLTSFRAERERAGRLAAVIRALQSR
jgi:YfiH family protein